MASPRSDNDVYNQKRRKWKHSINNNSFGTINVLKLVEISQTGEL